MRDTLFILGYRLLETIAKFFESSADKDALGLADSSELDKYLEKIQEVFDIPELLNQSISKEYMVDYYEQSSTGYKAFHSSEGAVHMALNFDGKFNTDGYFAQAKIVNEILAKTQPKNVLELGSGKGFNSIFLGKSHQAVEFIGIDLTPTHVEIAKKSGKGLSNVDFTQGNFQEMPFPSENFDLLFEVESVCHATDMRKALSEVYRVLRPGGKAVFFDGFRNYTKAEDVPHNLLVASQLVEGAMAIDKAWDIKEWLELSSEVGFQTIENQNLSEAIMPNLARFQRMAKGYFKSPQFAKILYRIMPQKLIKNSIAGLLMPFTIKADVQGYYQVVLEKPKS